MKRIRLSVLTKNDLWRKGRRTHLFPKRANLAKASSQRGFHSAVSFAFNYLDGEKLKKDTEQKGEEFSVNDTT